MLTKWPSLALNSSFPALSHFTHALAPQGCTPNKSGFSPVPISCSVFISGSASEGMQLQIHTWWWTASAHRFFGSPVASIMAWAPLIGLIGSTIRCWGVMNSKVVNHSSILKVFSELFTHEFPPLVTTKNSYLATSLDLYPCFILLVVSKCLWLPPQEEAPHGYGDLGRVHSTTL